MWTCQCVRPVDDSDISTSSRCKHLDLVEFLCRDRSDEKMILIYRQSVC